MRLRSEKSRDFSPRYRTQGIEDQIRFDLHRYRFPQNAPFAFLGLLRKELLFTEVVGKGISWQTKRGNPSPKIAGKGLSLGLKVKHFQLTEVAIPEYFTANFEGALHRKAQSQFLSRHRGKPAGVSRDQKPPDRTERKRRSYPDERILRHSRHSPLSIAIGVYLHLSLSTLRRMYTSPSKEPGAPLWEKKGELGQGFPEASISFPPGSTSERVDRGELERFRPLPKAKWGRLDNFPRCRRYRSPDRKAVAGLSARGRAQAGEAADQISERAEGRL